ncbi:AAA domain-containing protein [Cytophagaceae bacterium ABcell3]|nr:AAA domain-containing protein [Cytophagaceae bacterium ABcell3]
MQKILTSFLRKLTNLSSSNRSLLLLRLSAQQDIDLHTFDFLYKNTPSFTLIDQLIAGKAKIPLCDVADSREERVNNASRRLRMVMRRDNFIYEERGGKDLYVGWPFVQGRFNDGTLVRCPLMFFPVELQISGNQWLMVQREGESASLNKSFLLAYAYFNQVALDENLIETSISDFGSESQMFRTKLYELLKESPLEINFNQDLFIDKLVDFKQFKKPDFEEGSANGELKLLPEAVLGIFPQADSWLVPDYEQIIDNNNFKDLEDFFVSRTNIDDKGGTGFHFLSKIKEEQFFTPYKMDASQENAIKAVKKGNSVVVQGPPGTGKSQMICNLIADSIATGKRVLLVCQKRAALDVVYKRLQAYELTDFVGLVHDFKNDRRAIYQKIHHQTERLSEYKYKNNSLDSIFLERQFLQTSRQIDQVTEELEEFRQALYDDKEFGLSVKELYLNSDPEERHIPLKQEFRHFKSGDQDAFVRKIHAWFPYAERFRRFEYLWNDRVSFKDFALSDQKEILRLLDYIPFFQAELADNLREVLDTPLDFEECEWLNDRRDKAEQLLELVDDPAVYEFLQFVLNKQTDINWFLIREKQVMECFKGEDLEKSIESSQLVVVREAVEKAFQARKQPHKWLYWRLFSKDRFLLKRVFVANGLEWNREGFEKILQRLDNRMNLEHNITEMNEAVWLLDVPEDKNMHTMEEWMHRQHLALAAKEILLELRVLKDYLNIPSTSQKDFVKAIKRVLTLVNKVPQEKTHWLKYFTGRQISKILADYEYPLQLAAALKKDFDSLAEFDKITAEMPSHELSVMEKLFDEVKDGGASCAEKLFINSLHLEWIEQIESKYPVLRMVSSLKMEQAEKGLQDAVKEKIKLSREILLMKARERTYANASYNRLNNMVTYRDLAHQVSKKKRIWPIRKLVSAFSEELFELMPCWMASPETVSAIFPMEQLFDLVIFDEASQCYAEKGIPAMYRGRQIVVTGDDKQLAPNDMYQVRWDEEEDDTPELAVDSLLDLTSKYLMQVQLMGHYRSRSPELISFSNQNFYRNTLKLLPDVRVVNDEAPAIEYVKVDGLWENSINSEEADKVVELASAYFENSEQSVGIVTFNYKQQSYIRDLLDEWAIKNKKTVPESLFVKNIENVQGDERDVIIFSVGYAPDKNGRFAMQFGSLNAEKGENRLNVAVTRARHKIFLVSSILPNQLKVDHVKNLGPKLLKDYLQYAWEVSNGNYKPKGQETDINRGDWYLRKRLLDVRTEKDPELLDDMPFADLSVKANNRYVGLLLTDDNIYHQALSVKDFHAYAHLSMKEKKWKVRKVFSRQFWDSKTQTMDQIRKAFNAE